MSKISETNENKRLALARSRGLTIDYELDSSFSSDSQLGFQNDNVNVSNSTSNNISVLPNEFDTTSRILAGTLNNQQQSSSLLNVRSPGTGSLLSVDDKIRRTNEFNNTSNPTSTVTASNSPTVAPGIALWFDYAGSNQDPISITDFINQSSTSADSYEEVPPGNSNTITNQLGEYASYNCIFRLGVLTPSSINDPKNTYRKRGADFTILQSGGGGTTDKRVTTAFDDSVPGNLEYFLDNFNMNSILSPNSKTGMAVGTKLSFEIHEPYSMGVFLQNLKIAAAKAGYKNYLEAPFLLEIDFVGWDTEGQSKSVDLSSRKIPFKLSDIRFDAERAGSTYEVTGFPWNQQALSDVTQRIDDPVSIKGSTVASVLSFGEQSLTAVLNSKLREMSEADDLNASDLYVIRFPKSRTTQGVADASSTEESGATVSLETPESTNVNRTDQFVKRINTYFGANSPSTNNSVYQKLVGTSTTDVNKIGQALMVDNFNQGSNHPYPVGLATYDKEGDVYRRDGIELTLSDGERSFKFPQGMSIQKIIEELVLVSDYATNALDRIDKQGMITWFTIETECHILDIPQVEEATNSKPKVYVYNVVPYRVHASTMVSPNKGVPGAQSLVQQISKEYDYIYSGKNQDVLGFDIQFNTAFFEALRADYGNFSGSDVKGASDNLVNLGSNPYLKRDSEPGERGILDELFTNRYVSNIGDYTGGTEYTDPKRNLAKQFHNILLNSNVDLITANIEIWGDPYYLPDSGLGNYSARNSGQTATLTADGAIDYQRNEVDILVNFRTPVDYNNEGGMEFQSDTTLVRGFSGFYKVISVNSVISGNKFTQTLQLVRRKNQSNDGISTSRVVQESQGNGKNPNQNADNPADQTGAASE